jgi:REP element-mobilizing transposase RayT
MERANRHYIPNCIWHITHRCHKREFLLRFLKDRKRWIYWLFEAKKRFGLRILNYAVTSNHIHLLVIDSGSREPCWTESIAVGSSQFVEDTKVKLGLKARGRKVVENNDVFELKEPIAPYNAHLHTENDLLIHENMYYWEGSIINSTS